MILVLRNDDFDMACNVMDLLSKEQHSILGVPNINALSSFVDKCIERKAPTRAVV